MSCENSLESLLIARISSETLGKRKVRGRQAVSTTTTKNAVLPLAATVVCVCVTHSIFIGFSRFNLGNF